MRFNTISAVLAGLCLFAGCYEGNHHDEPAGATEGAVEETGTVHGTWTEIDSGDYGFYGNQEDAHVVVRDATAWSFLYFWLHGNPEEVPTVDFEQSIVAGILLSVRPNNGYEPQVLTVNWSGTKATVWYQESEPGFQDVITRPFSFLELTAVEGEVNFLPEGSVTIVGTDLDYPTLVTTDMSARTGTPSADPEHLPALNAGICPLDETTLAAAELPAAGTYTDLSNDAYYCSVHGDYWVRHVQGGFIGTITQWWGPYSPGIFYQ